MMRSTVVSLVGIVATAILLLPVVRLDARQTPPGQTVYAEQCATCHDNPEATKAPSLESLRARTPEAVVTALETGSMRTQGAALTADQRRSVAQFVTGKAFAEATAANPAAGLCATAAPPLSASSSRPTWLGWGNGPANTRFQPAAAAGISAADVPKLTLKWAFGFPNATEASAQPTVAFGRVFVGSARGPVYSLDAASGCIQWTFTAQAGVRTAISIGPSSGGRLAVYFGDLRASVYAVDAATGSEIWRTRVDDHAWARITGAPVLADGRVYVPVSSIEELPAAGAKYPCCTFRGSVVALDTATGKQIWKTHMIAEAPRVVGKNAGGVDLWKPAGAAIWSAPTIDDRRNSIYVATGNGYTEPAAATTDSIVALDRTTGAIQWVNQVTPGDAFVMNCRAGNLNCPDDPGPDHDFGSSPILRTLGGGRRILVVGQKSGMVYGLDPDNKGAILWQTRVGKGGALGGVEWGSAADEQAMYVATSDVLGPVNEAGGLTALRLATGEKLWHTAAPPRDCTRGPGCSGAQSAAVTAIPGVVFSGSIDGHMRAYSAADGRIVWDFNTMREFETVNGVKAMGGSIDTAGPVVADGLLITNSGYGRFLGKPGNVLLAFSAK
jgi:polyvinyl alcohol dehydrogenase (cytochrome)